MKEKDFDLDFFLKECEAWGIEVTDDPIGMGGFFIHGAPVNVEEVFFSRTTANAEILFCNDYSRQTIELKSTGVTQPLNSLFPNDNTVLAAA